MQERYCRHGQRNNSSGIFCRQIKELLSASPGAPLVELVALSVVLIKIVYLHDAAQQRAVVRVRRLHAGQRVPWFFHTAREWVFTPSNRGDKTMDYPNLRQMPNCPLCSKPKGLGPVVCRPCYRKTARVRHGFQPDIQKILATAELDRDLLSKDGSPRKPKIME